MLTCWLDRWVVGRSGRPGAASCLLIPPPRLGPTSSVQGIAVKYRCRHQSYKVVPKFNRSSLHTLLATIGRKSMRDQDFWSRDFANVRASGPKCIKALMIFSPWSKKLLLERDRFPWTSHFDVQMIQEKWGKGSEKSNRMDAYSWGQCRGDTGDVFVFSDTFSLFQDLFDSRIQGLTVKWTKTMSIGCEWSAPYFLISSRTLSLMIESHRWPTDPHMFTQNTNTQNKNNQTQTQTTSKHKHAHRW